MIKTYHLNFPNDVERFNYIKKSFSDSPYEYEIVEGINGHEQDRSRFNLNKDKKKYRGLSLGELGCYLGHIKMWKKALMDEVKIPMFFEDDAQIQPKFWKNVHLILEEMKEIKDWDIILLSHTFTYLKYKDEISDIKEVTKNLYSITGDHYGNQCYIVNPRVLNQLILTENFITYPADLALTNYNLKTYMINPNKSLTKQKRGFGSYTKDKQTYSKKFLT